MAGLVLRRVLNAIVLVAITVTLVFIVLHIIPGDPLAHYVEPGTSPADIERMRVSLGLDQPLYRQYLGWLGRTLTGNFGASILHQRPVRDLIAETLPRTLLLTALALCVQIALGSRLRRPPVPGSTIESGFWVGIRRQTLPSPSGSSRPWSEPISTPQLTHGSADSPTPDGQAGWN